MKGDRKIFTDAAHATYYIFGVFFCTDMWAFQKLIDPST